MQNGGEGCGSGAGEAMGRGGKNTACLFWGRQAVQAVFLTLVMPSYVFCGRLRGCEDELLLVEAVCRLFL